MVTLRFRKLRIVALLGLLFPLIAAVSRLPLASASTPIGQPMSGNMTWYDMTGTDACGQTLDASSQLLVAVASAWWTAANPNDDPLCQGISVRVTYDGTTITVPVEDKCATCSASQIDLSEPAFAELAPLSAGNVGGITWEFVSSVSGGSSTPAPAAQATTPPPSRAPIQQKAAHQATMPSPSPSPTPSQGGSCAPAWDSGTSYVPGQEVSYNGQNWAATFYSTGAVPNDPASWAVWAAAGACT
jgi:Lytic transglycolase